jgi:hypothetical protein
MRKLSLLAVVMLLAACGSGGLLGGLGTILGSPSSTQPSDVQGTVNFVDTQNQRIDLNVNYVNNLQTSQNSQSIYYDNRTQVVYQGRNYNVTDLERGDQVSVHGANNGGRYVADTITVTRNARG